MKEYEAIQKVFGDVKPITDAEFEAIFPRDKRGHPNYYVPILNEAVEELERQGYQFGCGAPQGCTPGCTC